MKNILCFGDSITYCFNPLDWTRYQYEDRWTTILEKELGEGYKVIVEGLDGRTTCWDLPYLPNRSGKDALPMIIESHAPLDLVIIMLGTNDMIKILNKTAENAAWGMFTLILAIRTSISGIGLPSPKILVICPPVLGKLSDFMAMSYSGREAESKRLAITYKILCDTVQCSFIDSNNFLSTSDPDGVHISQQSNKILGEKVAEVVKNILK